MFLSLRSVDFFINLKLPSSASIGDGMKLCRSFARGGDVDTRCGCG